MEQNVPRTNRRRVAPIMDVTQGTVEAAASMMGVARRYAITGVGLFFLSFIPGAIGNRAAGFQWLAPYADILVILGFALSLSGAVRAGTSVRGVLPLGLTFAVGVFYHIESHAAHIESGLGFGLDHAAHMALGLGLIGLATVTAMVLTFLRRGTWTSAKTFGGWEPQLPPGGVE